MTKLTNLFNLFFFCVPQILDSVLATFTTPSLLALASVSRRFHAVVEDLLYSRMRHAVCTRRYQLLLESYHPSARSLTPVLACDYLGTDGLDVCDSKSGSSSQSSRSSSCSRSRSRHGPGDDDDHSLGSLLSMYSRYHAHPQEDLWTQQRRARRGSMSPLASPTAVSAAALAAMGVRTPYRATTQPAYHDVFLDEGELFTQLCTVMHLSRGGSPRKGLYLSCGVINSSVVRIFRDWLARADSGKTAPANAMNNRNNNRNSSSSSGILHHDFDSSDSESDCGMDGDSMHGHSMHGHFEPDGSDGAILWADSEKNVGIRFRVTERQLPYSGPPARPFDEEPVAYTLEYRGWCFSFFLLPFFFNFFFYIFYIFLFSCFPFPVSCFLFLIPPLPLLSAC